MLRLIKVLARLALLAVVGIGLFVAALWLDHTRATALPTPTGPFSVGRTTAVWSDVAQEELMAPQPGTKRELSAWIWYPAEPRQQAQVLDDYFPVPWRKAVEQQRGIMKVLTRDLSRVQGNSTRDARVSSQQPSYPVVLMRGGLSSLVVSYTSLAEDLASHGYVVVGFDAPYRSSVVVFPDGRVIPRASQNNAELVGGAAKAQLATRLAQAWSADMSFAVDRLEQLNASDPSGRFLGRLDMARVGAFGHSLGGASALQFCHDDTRCKAVIDLDGIPFGSVVGEGVTQPAMFLMSDHTGDRADPEDAQLTPNFDSVFARLQRGRWSEIMIRGSGHYMFSDDAVLRSPPVMRVLRGLGVVHIDGRRQIAVTAHCISAFFDAYLKGPSASMPNISSSLYPEIQVLK